MCQLLTWRTGLLYQQARYHGRHLLVWSFTMGTVLGEVLNKTKYSFPLIYWVVSFLEIPGYINVQHVTQS